VFTPSGAPPGITVNLVAVNDSRPFLDEPCRLAIIHTNAAAERSTMATQRHFANGSDTTPTYEIGIDENDGAEKWLSSDRRSIANGTVVPGMDDWDEIGDQARAEILAHGRSATFSLAVETIDFGWRNGLGGFSDFAGERIARLLAYETITWARVGGGFPLAPPATWFGSGVGGHTIPFEFPFWTIHRGKTCPGADKKADLFNWILPRAREIHAAWQSPPTVPVVPFTGKVTNMFRACKFDGGFWFGNGVTSWHWPTAIPDKTEQALVLAEGLLDVKSKKVVHTWNAVGVLEREQRRDRYVGRPAQ